LNDSPKSIAIAMVTGEWFKMAADIQRKYFMAKTA
jgi:hypothetical protein